MFGWCSYINTGPTGTVCVFYFHILVDIYPEKMSLSSIGRTIFSYDLCNYFHNIDITWSIRFQIILDHAIDNVIDD
jgi:hypothetical protein